MYIFQGTFTLRYLEMRVLFSIQFMRDDTSAAKMNDTVFEDLSCWNSANICVGVEAGVWETDTSSSYWIDI